MTLDNVIRVYYIGDMETKATTIYTPAEAVHPSGSRSEYLATIARQFPMRNRHGSVTGFYVYDGSKEGPVAGPFPTLEEAETIVANSRPTLGSWRITTGHVFTASGKIVREIA